MPAISAVPAMGDLDVLFEYAFGSESLSAPDLTGIFGSSLRPLTSHPA